MIESNKLQIQILRPVKHTEAFSSNIFLRIPEKMLFLAFTLRL